MSKTLLKYSFIILIATLSFSFSKGAESDMQFIENKGQWPSQVKFQSPLNFGNVYFENNQFSFLFFEKGHHHQDHNGQCNHSASSDDEQLVQYHNYKIEFLNAQTQSIEKLSAPSEHYFNYLLGNNSATWQTHVHSFKAISYKNLYNGIDVLVQGNGENIKYDYIVAPQANVQQIQLKYWGVEKMHIENGHLFYETSLVGVQEEKPYAYQVVNGKKVAVACLYVLNNQTQSVSFSFPNGYNPNLELIIDPTLIFSRYSESSIGNFGFTATYDNLGRAYGGGSVFGTGYPITLGAYDQTFNGGTIDMGISCYHPTTGAIIYSTYIGGSNNEVPHSMIVNQAGELIVLGTSGSLDFPLSSLSSAYDNSFNGGTAANFPSNGVNYSTNGSDIVVFKLSNDGSTLLASTYLGGSGNDGLNDDATITGTYNGSDLHFNYGDVFRGEVMVDNFDNVYISSSSNSTNYPTMGIISSLQGEQDAVITKLDANLSNLLFSRYLGGSNDDAGYSLKINQAGDIFAVGGTLSNDFPTSLGVLQSNYGGGNGDGFIAKLDTSNGNILSATYLGTNSYDQIFLIELDASDDVYVVGQSLGTYPIQNASYGLANRKQFIHKLNSNLSNTFYSTTFGNSTTQVDISPTALLVDICERVYVGSWGGNTNSSRNTQATGNINGLPITSDALQATTNGGGDLYFFILDKNANGLLFGSYFGGTAAEHVDGGTSRFDAQGTIYQAVCAGCGGGTFSVSPGYSANTNPNSICNLGVIKLNLELPSTQVEVDAFPRATGCAPLLVNFESELINVSSFQWNFGDGTFSNQQNPIHLFVDTGVYTVQLIGIDSNSCNLADTALLTVEVSNNVLYPNFTDSIVITCSTTTLSINSPENYPATQYLWDMGDGTFYTTPSITHTYDTSGYYNITLNLADSTSCNLFDSVSYNVYLPPLFDLEISANTNNACLPFTANFQGISNSPTASYYWDFGDGNFSTQQNPSHLYSVAGNYTITFTGVDSNSCNLADTTILNIEIYDNLATVLYGTSENWLSCDSLELTVYSLVDSASHLWSFSNGISSTDSATTLLLESGNYQITYIVTDANQFCNPTDTANFSIYVQDKLDLNISVSDTAGCSPLNINFQTTGSSPASSFAWDFGNGQTATTANPSITFPNVGVFAVTVIATDSSTCNISDTATLTIETFSNQAIAAYATSENWLNCDSLELTVYSLVPNASHAWNFGNGQTSTDSSTTVLFTTGAYQVTYIVNDAAQFCAPTDTASFPINILERLELQVATPDTSACIPLHVYFQAASNTAASSFAWDFGNGQTATTANPSITFPNVGVFAVTVIATDSSTCNISDTATLTIETFSNQAIAAYATSENWLNCDSLELTVYSLVPNASHTWNFGNGQTSTDSSTTVLFTTGAYQVTYIVNDAAQFCAPTDTATFPINILERLELQVASPDTAACIPLQVNFQASSNTPASSFAWDFGNGQTAFTANPNITFPNVGVFAVTVIATDSSTCNISDTATLTIETFSNQATAAYATSENWLNCDSLELTVYSLVPNASHAWNFGNGQTSTDSSTTVLFTTGAYQVTYIVNDAAQFCAPSDTASFPINILERLELQVASPDTAACIPLQVNFQASSNTPASSFAWDFGNGQTAFTANPNITFPNVGVFAVTVIATDSSTCNISDTATLTIETFSNQATAAYATSENWLNCDSLELTVYSLVPNASHAWNFGNGQTSTDSSATVLFTTGAYQVTYIVNDAAQFCAPSDTASFPINILERLELQVASPDTAACIPLQVNFQASSNTPASSFAWDFGNGQTAFTANPNITFPNVGVFAVTVITTDSSTCNISDTATLTIETFSNQATAAYATSENWLNCDSLELTVYSLVPNASHAWNFGNGQTSTDSSTTVLFTTGAYQVTYIVNDAAQFCAPSDTASFPITILERLELQVASPDTSACIPLQVNFQASSNTAASSFAWDFGNGQTAFTANPNITFPNVGVFAVTVIATDSSSCNISDTATLTIETFSNQAIAAYATSENWLNCDSLELTVYSLVPNASHAWNFGNGQTSTDSSTTVLFTTGAYQVTYIVNDAAQFCAPTDTASFPINILERLELQVASPDTAACIPLQVNFQASSNTPTSSFAWDFGNGQTAFTANPTITFPSVGVFAVTVIATDSSSCNISDTATLTIETFSNQAIAAYATSENWLNCDSLELTVYSLVPNASHAWNFGNGQTSTDSSTTVLFTTGAYQVTYIVNDAAQFCAPTDTASFPITILERLEIDLVVPNFSACSPIQVNFTTTSNANQASYFWDFGDGTFSSLSNPSKTYASGNYTAFVIVSDTGFCNVSDTAFSLISSIDYIDSATFILTETLPSCDSLILQALSTTANANFHYWDFGNGETSSLANAIAHYGPGNYQGFYIASTNVSNCSQSDTSYFEITVPEALNSNPQVANLKGCIPFDVDFTAGTYPANTSYLWNFGNGQTSTLANPQFTFQNVGAYPVSLIVSNPNSCNLADTTIITIFAINDQSQASMQVDEEVFACDSLVLHFNSNNAFGNHFWQISDGSQYTSANGSHSFNSFGNFSLQYVLIDSSMVCKITDTLSYTVDFIGVEANFVASDTVGCFPLLVDFNNLSTNANSYWWSIGNVTGTSNNLPSYNFTQAGAYTFTLVAMNPNTCNELDTMQIDITINDGSVNANFSAQVLHACDSLLSIELINLSWQATEYLWDFGTYTSTIENPGIVNFTEPGTYTITLYANNPNLCYGIDTISRIFTLLPNIVAKFSAEPICLGSSLSLENESAPYTSDVVWNFGNGSTANSWNAEYLYNSIGNYIITLQVIDSNTCNIVDTSMQSIEVLSRPKAGFETDASIYDLYQEVIFTNTSTLYEEILWVLGDGYTSNETNQFTYSFQDITKYNNCIIASNIACKDTFCDEIIVDYEGLIGVPNAFSPNNDGVNDVVYVEGNGIMQLNFRIYNRWGELVFQSFNQNDGWDGITRGVAQEMEVYTYIVDAILADGTKPVLKGNITLLR